MLSAIFSQLTTQQLPSAGVLEPVLRALTEKARAAHVELSVSDASWVQTLARAWNGEGELLAFLAEVKADDLYLASACELKSADAMAKVESTLLPQVRASIAGVNSSPDFVEEVLQQLRCRLFFPQEERSLFAWYKGQGAMLAWLRAVAVRMAVRQRSPPEADATALAAAHEDPELRYLKTQYREAFHSAFARALETLVGRDRAVLKLYVVDALTLDEIGRVFQVHGASVSRWVASIRSQLLEKTRAVLAESLRLQRSELDSLMRFVNSSLDASLASFLRRSA